MRCLGWALVALLLVGLGVALWVGAAKWPGRYQAIGPDGFNLVVLDTVTGDFRVYHRGNRWEPYDLVAAQRR